MKLAITSVVASVITFCSISATAADQNGLFAIRGAGLLTCDIYVRERAAKSDTYLMIGGWLDGYVTAVNELSYDTFDVSSYASTELITLLVERHCIDNPTDIVFGVTNGILARLNDDRLRQSSPYTGVRVGDRAMRIYKDTVRRIQSKLRNMDLYNGEESGEWNSATEKALAVYQESVGLRETGFPDQTTLWQLLRSQ